MCTKRTVEASQRIDPPIVPLKLTVPYATKEEVAAGGARSGSSLCAVVGAGLPAGEGGAVGAATAGAAMPMAAAPADASGGAPVPPPVP